MTRYGTCSVDGCDGWVHARGWCMRHYSRWRNHGDTDRLVTRDQSSYCICRVPVVGWWRVECGRCYRLIEGAIPEVLHAHL